MYIVDLKMQKLKLHIYKLEKSLLVLLTSGWGKDASNSY